MQTLQLENQATKLNFVFYNIIKVATPLPQKDSKNVKVPNFYLKTTEDTRRRNKTKQAWVRRN